MSILKKPIKIKYYFIFIENETCGPIALAHAPTRHTRAGFWRGFCISIEWRQNRIGQSGRQMAGDQQADR